MALDIKREISTCAAVLKAGGIALIPTDTVWGLSCDASNYKAVQKLSNLKNRTEVQGYVVLIHEIGMLYRYNDEVNDAAVDLMVESTEPTSVVFNKPMSLAANATHANGSAAFRLVSKGIVAGILKELYLPLVSTSANIHGEPTPQKFSAISQKLIQSADYVFPGEIDEFLNFKSPSAIVAFDSKGLPKKLR